MTPAVSVVMPVYRDAPYLAEAMKSLAAQTFGDFEIVAMDTCGHDAFTASLNASVRAARAPLIARMDADDVCRPDRLARQVREFDRDPHLGLCGTWCIEIDAAGKALRQLTPPCGDAALKRALIRRNPFVHASVMFTRDAYDRAGGYDERFAVGQDWDLWLRMAAVTRLGMVNHVGVLRRVWAGQVSQTRRRAQRWAGIVARYEAIQRGQYPKRNLARLVGPLVRCGLWG